MACASDYAKFAEQCLDMAEHVPPKKRKALLKMAEAWLELAHSALLKRETTEPRQTAPTSDNLQ